ncbi:MAG: hypothetical protein Q8R37_03940 [Nanoarchaeota archaeon]|nr:hypothetical protein [Nanoarchaeota archaeon]
MENVKVSLDDKMLEAVKNIIQYHGDRKQTFAIRCRGPYTDLSEPITALVTIGAGSADHQQSFVLCPRLQNDLKYKDPNSPFLDKTATSSEPWCYVKNNLPPVVTEEEFYGHGIYKCPYVK